MTICTLQRVDYIWFCLILNFEKKLTYYSALLATKIDFLLFRKKYKKIKGIYPSLNNAILLKI